MLGVKELQNLSIGGVSGCISRTAVSPLERLKILYQVQYVTLQGRRGAKAKYGSVLSSLATIYREEGIAGFYKGNGANCFRVFPYIGLQFMCFEKYKEVAIRCFPQSAAQAQEGQITGKQKLVVGGLAGMTSVLITYPLDVVRGRLTAQGGATDTRYKGILDTIRVMVRTEGWRSLYCGMAPALIGVAPYVGVNYLTFETLKEWIPARDADKGHSAGTLMVCGGVAGTTGQTVAYPMDLIRRRFQMQRSDGRRMYSSIADAFSTIVREEGALGLYKGFLPNFVKVVPTIAIMFFCNDLIRKELRKRELLHV